MGNHGGSSPSARTNPAEGGIDPEAALRSPSEARTLADEGAEGFSLHLRGYFDIIRAHIL